MWHSASLSTLLSLSLALISDANLWSENNKGSWRILTCRYCGCCRSVYSERDGKWDVFHLHLHPDSIFDYLLLTCSSSLLCSWKPALCGIGGRRKKIGDVLLDWWIPICGFVFSWIRGVFFLWVCFFLWICFFSVDLFFFPGSQGVWMYCLWKVISIFLWVWMFQLGNQIPFEEMCQSGVINQTCSNWKGRDTTRNGRCVPCWKWWQFSTERVSKNILRLLRGFVIKSNLNKIIALLFINWKLVRFYGYTLTVLEEMQNTREVFGGMENVPMSTGI